MIRSSVLSFVPVLSFMTLIGCGDSKNDPPPQREGARQRQELSQRVRKGYSDLAKANGRFVEVLQPFLEMQDGNRANLQRAFEDFRKSLKETKEKTADLGTSTVSDSQDLVEAFGKYLSVYEDNLAKGYAEIVDKLDKADRPPSVVLEISLLYLACNDPEKSARAALVKAIDSFDRRLE